MDIKHRRVWLRVKLSGIAQPLEFDAPCMVQAMNRLLREMQDAPNRYGPIAMEAQFEPFDAHKTQAQIEYEKLLGQIDPASIEQESDEEAEMWSHSPMNRESPAYDPIYGEYIKCNATPYRDTKTSEDLNLIRIHVGTKYANTPWWNGIHRW